MEAKYVRPEDYKRMELALGPAKAEAWRVKHDLIVGMPPEENTVDDNEPEDGAEEKDFAVAAPPSATQRKAAKTGDKGALAMLDAYGGYEEAQKNVMAQAQANLDLLKAGQEALRNRRLGPSNAEKWFAIAAALGQPTRTGSFGEGLGNLNRALYETKSAQREAQEKREMMLEKYGMDIGEQQLRMLMTAANQAGQNYRAAVAAAKPRSGTWSENMMQFVNPDKPVATPNKVTVGKYVLTQYTDGSLRLKNADGSFTVYSEDGRKIGDIPAGGAQ